MNYYPLKTLYFKLIVTLAMFIPFGIAGQPAGEDNWELGKEKDGITVYTRVMEGKKLKEYMAVCEVDATPEQLVDILYDIENYVNWMDNVKEAELIETDGENIFYVYSQVKVPFPFDNRDQVTKSVIVDDSLSDKKTIEVEIIPGYIPEKKGVVRVPFGEGLWEFIPLENGKTKINHRFGAEPGGSIPAWVVNMFLVDSPIKTMEGLKEQVANLYN